MPNAIELDPDDFKGESMVRTDDVWEILERFEETINGVKQVIAILPGRCRKVDSSGQCPYYKVTDNGECGEYRECLFHMRSVHEIKNCIFAEGHTCESE
jgi:hypothetical protein